MEEKRNAYKMLLENVKKRDHLEALGIDGRVILISVLKGGLESVNWILLAKDTDQWWGLVGKGN
jgi:hypothetical protein